MERNYCGVTGFKMVTKQNNTLGMFIPELSQIWYSHSGTDKADYMGLSYCTPPHH